MWYVHYMITQIYFTQTTHMWVTAGICIQEQFVCGNRSSSPSFVIMWSTVWVADWVFVGVADLWLRENHPHSTRWLVFFVVQHTNKKKLLIKNRFMHFNWEYPTFREAFLYMYFLFHATRETDAHWYIYIKRANWKTLFKTRLPFYNDVISQFCV